MVTNPEPHNLTHGAKCLACELEPLRTPLPTKDKTGNLPNGKLPVRRFFGTHLNDDRRLLYSSCQLRPLSKLTLAGLETRILLVDHKNFAVTAHNLSARLVLQRPKGLTDLHRALLSSSAELVKAKHLW